MHNYTLTEVLRKTILKLSCPYIIIEEANKDLLNTKRTINFISKFRHKLQEKIQET